MSAVSLVIVGAGGFGREIFDSIRHSDPAEKRFRILGFVDENPDRELLAAMGTQWLGSDAEFLSQSTTLNYVLAVGEPHLRQALATKYGDAGLTAVTFVHSAAVIGSNVIIGEGSIISAHAMVMNGSRIGRFVNVDRGAAVGHDGRVADFATLHPQAIVSGRVSLGMRSRLGTCACVLPNVSVGDDSIVGAGAVVTTDVPASTVAVGVPARPSGQQSS